MANPYYQSADYKVIQAMKASGNRPGIVRQWRELVQLWSLDHTGPQAEAIRAWLPYWTVRPFYTAAELAPIMPALAATFGFAPRLTAQKSPNRLANELSFGGLPRLLHTDREDNAFKSPVTGQFDRYFIVERLHHWKNRGWTQEDFEKAFEL